MAIDLVEVLEAAYAQGGSDEEWLARVVGAARPALDAGLGVMGFFYDVADVSATRVWAPVVAGAPAGAEEALYAINANAPSDLAGKLFRAIPAVGTMSETLGGAARVREEPLYDAVLAPLGVHDFFSVAATDPCGAGVLVGAPLAKLTKVTRKTAAVWERVAAHLAAASRLRRRGGARIDSADAVLTADGRLAHANHDDAKDGRDALERSARAMDEARGALRKRDPGAAIEAWTALVSGRWTLVDHFDHDGRRYVVARRNDPDVRGDVEGDASSLTRREEQVVAYAAMGHANKLIAYELGLAPSTIAMHLSSAARKLGVSSRVALIRAWQRAKG